MFSILIEKQEPHEVKRDNKKQKRKTRKLHERIHPRHSTHRTKKITRSRKEKQENFTKEYIRGTAHTEPRRYQKRTKTQRKSKTKTKRQLYFAFKTDIHTLLESLFVIHYIYCIIPLFKHLLTVG